jgi:hypothetical protein
VKHLGDDVKRELSRFGPAAGLADLVEAWPAAVGETIARNAWPARVSRDGTLHVNTLDSIWAFELTNRATDIAPRLGIAAVRFAPGPLPEAPAETPPGAQDRAIAPSTAVQAEGERLAAGIEDENLRKIVARAAAASLSRRLSDRSV